MESPDCLQNPHCILGLHRIDDKTQVIRLWSPGASELYLEVKGAIVSARKVDSEGFFELVVPGTLKEHEYRIYYRNGMLVRDPYSFPPFFGELDSYLFSRGVNYKIYEILGARLFEYLGCRGVKFSVWAPGAHAVSLVGDFNGWDGRVTPMRKIEHCGIWEIFIPGLDILERYKFQITGQDGIQRLKSDPFAYYSELRPQNASVVFGVDDYDWQDKEWMNKRLQSGINEPMNIYEVHLGSWKKTKDSSNYGFLNYREIAHLLGDYVKEMGFTHIEILPLAEHPLDESWGYQVSGFYSVTSRYGTPSDFQYFVNYMHQNGIGVIIDWVAAHFPVDDFSLSNFDGTCLYEHADPRQGYHPDWNTNIFNVGRFEVSNFLIANALFWLDKMHIDGLRVDAVASMIYLDYGRKGGEWVANINGGRENLEAIEFLKHLNSVVHEKFPKTLMIAEESTSFRGVTHPLAWEGLGFDLKWNMGWMNDTLKYFKTDPLFRQYEHEALTFGQLYIFSERFLLPLSHDEVVHCKASMLSKMPGDEWQKFANLRLLLSYMICQPGKKLLFMGGEIGQWSEWSCKGQIDWAALEYFRHRGIQKMVKDLNLFYQKHEALWRKDFEGDGFKWVSLADRANSVISYLRKGESSVLLCVHNFTPVYFEEYAISLRGMKCVQEVFSTDKEEYGGSGKENRSPLVLRNGEEIILHLAPLSTMIFEVQFT